MNFRWMDVESQSPRPALDLISLACMAPEQARQNLRSLLVADPNYFGSLSDGSFKAVLQIQEDTAYEQLCRVEYHPDLEMLRATFEVNKSNGYSTELRSTGSLEYVRFYLSRDEGASWHDCGVRVAHVFDAPGPKPLGYAVTQTVRLRERGKVYEAPVRVRAILSWNQIPPADEPNWLPVWGNVLDTVISTDAIASSEKSLDDSRGTEASAESKREGQWSHDVVLRSARVREQVIHRQAALSDGSPLRI